MFALVLFLCIEFVVAVITTENTRSNQLEQFNYCMRQKQQPHITECVGRTALSFLQRVDEQENFTLINDFVAKKDEKLAARSLVNLFDIDPVDFRGIMENAGAVFSQRNLEWHMDNLYPGLMLKIGPTADANSVAEFVVDSAKHVKNYAYDEPASTARILTKQYLLPILLGLKFNLAALVPIVFTGICLLLKKSLFLVKFIIFLSSILGVGGAAGALGSFGAISNLASLGGLDRPSNIRPSGLGWGGLSGFIPGKTTIYNEEYETEDLAHNAPYKRNGRKIRFEKPKEKPTIPPINTTPDHFYDYEKLLMQYQDRSRESTNRQLPQTTEQTHLSNNGWKVIDLSG